METWVVLAGLALAVAVVKTMVESAPDATEPRLVARAARAVEDLDRLESETAQRRSDAARTEAQMAARATPPAELAAAAGHG